MKHFLTIIFIFISLFLKSQINSSLTIGEVKTIRSEVLNENRILNIYLPEKYDKEKSYPVMYLLDGSINEDFLHIVGLMQFFNLQFQAPECIVVGIANVDRKRDFTFHTDIEDLKKNYPTTGHSEAFINFIATELQPYIQSNYNTTDTKYLIGQSLGGLLATEILLKKPELFSHYLIVSPSLWWDEESLLKSAETLLAKQTDLNKYVYISVGKKEHKIMKKEAKAIYKILKKAKKQNLKLDYLMMKDEDHATILHRSIYEAFLRLFPLKQE